MLLNLLDLQSNAPTTDRCSPRTERDFAEDMISAFYRSCQGGASLLVVSGCGLVNLVFIELFQNTWYDLKHAKSE